MKKLLINTFIVVVIVVGCDRVQGKTIAKLGAFKHNGDMAIDKNNNGRLDGGEKVTCVGCVDWYWAFDVTGEKFQAGRYDETGQWYDGSGKDPAVPIGP